MLGVTFSSSLKPFNQPVYLLHSFCIVNCSMLAAFHLTRVINLYVTSSGTDFIFMSLLCIVWEFSGCLFQLSSQQPIRIWVDRNCQRNQEPFPPWVIQTSIHPLVFCLCVIESTSTCLYGSDLIVMVLWVLKEGFEWRQFYCGGLCAIHVPSLYNRFLVYI